MHKYIKIIYRVHVISVEYPINPLDSGTPQSHLSFTSHNLSDCVDPPFRSTK
jgi:hypothetical protein